MLADTSVEVFLGMSFFSLRNAKFQFGAGKLIWRLYIAVEALHTTRQVELIDKKEFAKAAMEKNFEIFVVHVAALESQSTPLRQPKLHHKALASLLWPLCSGIRPLPSFHPSTQIMLTSFWLTS